MLSPLPLIFLIMPLLSMFNVDLELEKNLFMLLDLLSHNHVHYLRNHQFWFLEWTTDRGDNVFPTFKQLTKD